MKLYSCLRIKKTLNNHKLLTQITTKISYTKIWIHDLSNWIKEWIKSQFSILINKWIAGVPILAYDTVNCTSPITPLAARFTDMTQRPARSTPSSHSHPPARALSPRLLCQAVWSQRRIDAPFVSSKLTTLPPLGSLATSVQSYLRNVRQACGLLAVAYGRDAAISGGNAMVLPRSSLPLRSWDRESPRLARRSVGVTVSWAFSSRRVNDLYPAGLFERWVFSYSVYFF